MNKILIFLLFAPFNIFSQELFSDTPNNVDSLGFVNKESSPNYIGVNVAPLVSGVINTKNNYNIKLSALYKRNFGYKNLRISLNHLTEGSISSYDYNIPIKSNLTIMFKELKTEFTRPIRLLGTLLNKYVVRKILTPALVIPIIKFPIKKIQIKLNSDIK